jgi:hypothetical protein
VLLFGNEFIGCGAIGGYLGITNLGANKVLVSEGELIGIPQ